MFMAEHRTLFTAHNFLFIILTIALPISKAMLVYQGQSATPNTIDLVYGIFVALG